MGFSFNGRCYQDGPTVLDAFKIQFPIVDGTSVVDLVSSSISTATTPVLSYQVLSRQWSNNTLASRTGSITLEPCNEPSNVQLLPDYWIALFVGCCVMFGLGFLASK